jgi:hypothetical protein
MSVNQIVATPAGKPAAKDCALFMWGMWVMLPEALRAVDALGVQVQDLCYWRVKAVSRTYFATTQTVKEVSVTGCARIANSVL